MMILRTTTITVTTISAILLPSTVLANPVAMTGSVSLIAVPFLLPLEGWLIAKWARDSSVFLARFVLVWTLITGLTLGLLILVVAGMPDTVPVLAVVIGGQLAIVLVEAWCVMGLLGCGVFARNPVARPGFGRSLAYSAGANLISFVGGVLAVGFA